MTRLFLKTGGLLEYVAWSSNDDTGEEKWIRSDVTPDVAAYLLDAVEFEGEVYLRDIFTLLERSPTLLTLFARLRASEYLAEAKRRPAVPYNGEYDVDGIEYLELAPFWLPEGNAGLSLGHRLLLAGVSHILRQDVELEGGMQYRAGDRIRWSLLCCPLAELWNVPLRYNGKVCLTGNNDVDTTNVPGLFTSLQVVPSLAQVIQGVLWELSFAGDPAQTTEFVERLRQSESDTDAWTAISPEELIARLGEGKSG